MQDELEISGTIEATARIQVIEQRTANLESLVSHLTDKLNRAEINAANALSVSSEAIPSGNAIAAIDAAIEVIDRVNVELAATSVEQREGARTFLQRVRYYLSGL